MKSRSLWVKTVGVTFVLGSLQACSGPSETSLLASAQQHLSQNKTESALIDIKSALQQNSGSPAARYLLGKTLLGTGEISAAELELRKALDAGYPEDLVVPTLARAMLLLGQHSALIARFADTRLGDSAAQAELAASLAGAYAQTGDTDKARATAEAALRAKPHAADAVLVLARLRSMAGDNDGALQLIDGLLQKEPDHEFGGAAKGELLWYGRQDTEGALAAFRQVLAKHPASIRAHASIITILFQRGQVQEARQQLEALKKLVPQNSETVFFDAQFAFVDKDYNRARELTATLIKTEQPNVRALELAAVTEVQLGQDLRAQSLLAQALKAQPSLVLARQLLARIQLRAGQAAKAIETLQPLLSLQRPASTTLTLLGEARMQLGEIKQAEAAFNQAARAAPGDARPRTAAAVARVAAGQSAGGIADLEGIAAKDSGVSADMALISAQLERGNVAAALKAIDVLEKKQPTQPLAPLLRGQVLAAQRNVPGAKAAFESALSRRPGYFQAVAGLAAIEVVSGQADEARKRLLAFLKANPKNPDALLAMTELAESSGSALPQVLRVAREGVLANPTEARLHLALVTRLMNAGDQSSALAAAQAAAAALPTDSSVQELLGRAQIAAGDDQQALSTYNTLVSLQPQSAPYQMGLATVHLALKDQRSAMRALRKAVELDPHSTAARRNLVAMLLTAGQAEAALDLAREAQRLDGRDGTGWSLEGDIAIRRRDWVAASTALKAALERSKAPDDALKLHAVYETSGRTADAKRLAADWLKSRPNDVTFRFHLGDLALRKQDLSVAESHYRSVLAVQPRNPLALNNVAWLMVKQGKPGAVALAEQANAQLPDRVPFLDTLAMAQAAEGQLPKALETQRRALARSPDDPVIRLGLARYLVRAGEKQGARTELEKLRALGDRFAEQAEVTNLLKTL